VDTGALGSLVEPVIMNEFSRLSDRLSNPPQPIVEVAEAADEATAEATSEATDEATDEATAEAAASQDANQILQWVENGLDLSALWNFEARRIGFGSGFTESPQLKDVVNLPVLFGPGLGMAALALGIAPQIESASIKATIDNSKLIIVHLTDQWLDSITSACHWLGNALFIIHSTEIDATTTDTATATQLGRQQLEAKFNHICTNGLVMAGPNSIVLVEVNQELFWYRGVRWPGLTEIPKFGDRVTEQFQIENLRNIVLPFDLVVSRGTSKVLWFGEMVEIDQAVTSFLQLSLDQMYEQEDHIIDVLTQLSILLNPEKLKQISTQFDQYIMHLIKKENQPYRQQIIDFQQGKDADADADADTPAVVDLVKISREMAQMKKTIRNKIRKISNALENLVSFQGSSSRDHDLKRRIRKTTIASNVEKSKSMTIDEKCDLLEQTCTQVGILFTNVNDTSLDQLLNSIGSGNLLSYYMTNKPLMHDIAQANGHLGVVLDALTTGVLLEVSVNDTDHLLAGSSQSIAIRSHPTSRISSIPFILLDRHVNCEDPGTLHWPEECNIEEVAMWRIMTRGTLAEATSSRQHNISASSKDLGFFIAHIIISTMEKLVAGISVKPTS